MWNGSICLIQTETEEQNKNGFAQEEHVLSEEIPANITDTTRTDEVVGNQLGYKEAYFKDVGTGTVYETKRTYQPPNSMNIILTGEAREHGKI